MATEQFNNGQMHMCFEVFMAVIVQILSPWLLHSADLHVATNISEEHSASIFRVEVSMARM
jgi:hypothetical protein